MEILPQVKKKTQKIRRSFLNREPLQEEVEDLPLEYTYQFLSDHKIRVVNPYIGMVEVNDQLLISPEYVNIHLKITNSQIFDNMDSKTLVLNINFDHRGSLLPWEHTVMKLESFDNEICRQWESRLRRYHENLPITIKDYLNNFYSEDGNISKIFHKIKLKVVLACREIESQYAYRKIVFFAHKDSYDIMEISFNEKFLKKIGHTPEGFASWIQENSLPSLVDHHSPPHLDVVQKFLKKVKEGLLHIKYEGPECIVRVDCKDGQKKWRKGKYIIIVDPTPEGFFTYAYLVFGGRKSTSKRTYMSQIAIKKEIIDNDSKIQVENDQHGSLINSSEMIIE